VIQGVIADRVGIHHAFFLPGLCYLYIVYIVLRAERIEAEQRALREGLTVRWQHPTPPGICMDVKRKELRGKGFVNV
jgi:hypothetical protein